MSSAARKVQRALRRKRIERAERMGIAIDGGLGAAAMAAILARPRGPARALEAAMWARRAADTVDQVAVVVDPGGAGDDWVDAHVELMLALHAERERRACGIEVA